MLANQANKTVDYHFAEVTPAEAAELRNLPKLPAICQFMSLFRHVLRINASGGHEQNYSVYAGGTGSGSNKEKSITAQDLAQSILRPQFDPLVGELVSRLLQKNKWKLKEGAVTAADKSADNDAGPQNSQSYEQWNENLAKKFNVMYKNYKKFQLRFMKEEEKATSIPDPEAELQTPGERKSLLIDGKYTVPVSHNIREHLLQSKDMNLVAKFEHEYSATWKTDQLQLVKLFEIDLGGIDPFYIEGQDLVRHQKREEDKAKQKENIYNSYVDTEAIDDFDDYQLPEPDKSQIQIQYKKFHEIPIKTRVEILFYLCQTRLDQESPEFMQEIGAIQSQRKQQTASMKDKEKGKGKNKDAKGKQATKKNAEGHEEEHKDDDAEAKDESKANDDFIKLMNDPFHMLYIKPLGSIDEDIHQSINMQESITIKQGSYYYLPQLQESKLYRHNPKERPEQKDKDKSGFGEFELLCGNFAQMQILVSQLSCVIQNQRGQQAERAQTSDSQLQQCTTLHDNLVKCLAQFRRFDELTQQRESSRFRKMQTLHRQIAYKQKAQSRLSRREDMETNQVQRKQVAVVVAGGSSLPVEHQDQDFKKRDQKLHQSKLERERRLERRMMCKEGNGENEEVEIYNNTSNSYRRDDDQMQYGQQSTRISQGFNDQQFIPSYGEAGPAFDKEQIVEADNTISGRQNRKPKYLKDYEQSQSDEDFDAVVPSEEEDESGEEYVHGRYKKVKKGQVIIGRGRGPGGRPMPAPEPNKKRQKISMMPSDRQMPAFGGQGQGRAVHDQMGSKRSSARDDNQGIELQGNLLLIYVRNNINRLQIDNLNVVLKGLWRLTENRDAAQDFIYKRTFQSPTVQDPSETEEALLKEYFYEDDINTEMIDQEIGSDHKNLIEIANHRLMLTKLFQSQGSYEGFFNYNGEQVSERFTLIMRKKSSQPLWDIATNKQNSKLSLFGYGENNAMGPFLLEGYCEVVLVPELVEKEGLKVEKQNQQEPMFMKLKIAKFVLRKRYQSLFLKELVEEKKAQRQAQFHRQILQQQQQSHQTSSRNVQEFNLQQVLMQKAKQFQQPMLVQQQPAQQLQYGGQSSLAIENARMQQVHQQQLQQQAQVQPQQQSMLQQLVSHSHEQDLLQVLQQRVQQQLQQQLSESTPQHPQLGAASIDQQQQFQLTQQLSPEEQQRLLLHQMFQQQQQQYNQQNQQ